MDAGLGQARRLRDLLLCVPLLGGLADQPVSPGVQPFYAADFVPYLTKLG
jgi:hypothetical protein